MRDAPLQTKINQRSLETPEQRKNNENNALAIPTARKSLKTIDLKSGDEGETLSSLKPIGKALIKEHELEVRSSGNFIAEKQKIKVIKIDNNKIFVEPLT